MVKNSITLHYIHLKSPLTQKVFNSYLNLVPADEQQRILRFLRWEDAHGCLLGKIALLKAFEVNSISMHLSEIKRTEFGKPYLTGEYFFNISHTNNLVVCGVNAGNRIGVDAEKIKPVLLDDFENQFNVNELAQIRSSVNPNLTFFKYWCIKEAAVKADGRGLSIPLHDVCIEDEQVTIANACSYFYKTFSLPGDFMIAVVTETHFLNIDLIDISYLANSNIDQLPIANNK